MVYGFNPMQPLIRLLVNFRLLLLLVLFLFFNLPPQLRQTLISGIIDKPRELPDFHPLLQVFNIDLLLYLLIQVVCEVSLEV